jgi:hypothetical protein
MSSSSYSASYEVETTAITIMCPNLNQRSGTQLNLISWESYFMSLISCMLLTLLTHCCLVQNFDCRTLQTAPGRGSSRWNQKLIKDFLSFRILYTKTKNIFRI